MAQKDLDSLIAQELVFEEKKAVTTQSMDFGFRQNPDEYANAIKVSKDTGVEPQQAIKYKDELEQRSRMQMFPVDDLVRNSPRTADFLADPNNAAVAQDDVPVLQRIERAFSAFKQGIEKGSIQDELGGLNYKAYLGTITADEEVQRKGLKAKMAGLDKAPEKTDSAVSYFLNQTGYAGRQMVSSVREGGKGGVAGATVGAGAAAIAGQLGPQVAVPEEVVTVPGAAALGFRAGYITSSTVYNYKMESGFAYDEFSDLKDENGKPLPRNIVVGAAATVGLLNSGLETVGDLAMVKLFPGADKVLSLGPKEAVKQLLARPTFRAALAEAGTRWAKAATAEGMTEALQEVSLLLGREAQQAFSGQTFAPDNFTDDAKRVGMAGFDAFLGSVGIGAVPAGYRGYRNVREVQQAQLNSEVIQALGETATESKTRTRLPEKFRELVDRVTEDGPIQNIYIPAEKFQTFFQEQGVDPAQVATESGAKNYTEALAAGTDVVIPVGRYAETLAASKFHQGLAGDIRLRQGDMTTNELAAYMDDREQRDAEILAQAKAAAGEIQTDALQRIKSDMMGQLLGTGYERGTADAYATVYAKTMKNLAERAGQDPMALHEQYGLNVTRPLPDVLAKNTQSDIQLDPLLDRLRSGTFPSDEEIFGKSLIEFIREKGGMLPAGELQDIDYKNKPFQRNFIQKTGMSADQAAEAAVSAGYFPELDISSITERDIFDAIDDELRGGQVRYSDEKFDQRQLDLREALNQLYDYLESLGIDLRAITDNAQVRRLIDEASQNPGVQGVAQQLYQLAQQFMGAQQQAQQGEATLFQDEKTGQDVRNLVALHNMSAENVRYVDSIGGLPVPSIGITKVDSQFQGFGEITLIGGKDMIDPANGVPVFSSDAYSARFPDIIWKKVSTKKAQALVDEMRKTFNSVDDRRTIDEVWDNLVNNPNRDRAVDRFLQSNGGKVAYIQSQGGTFEPIMRNVPTMFPWVGDEQFAQTLERLMPTFELRGDENADKVAQAESELRQAAISAIDRYIAGNAQYQGIANDLGMDEARRLLSVTWGIDGTWLTEGNVGIGIIDRLARDVKNANKQEVDTYATRDALKEIVSENDPAYIEFVRGKIVPLFDDPKIKVGGKQVAMTLDNIVEAMTSKSVRGKEKTMTFSSGQVAAATAKRFKSLEEIQAMRDMIVSPEAEKQAKEDTDKVLEDYRTAALRYYTERNYRGEVDTWNGLDAAMKVLADAHKKGGGEQSIERALRANNFAEFDSEIVDLARDAILSMRSAVTDYFEAKPQRAVMLNEFSGAVVPQSTPQDVVDILTKAGLEVRVAEEATRQETVAQLAKDLDAQSGGILFQGEGDQLADKRGYIQFGKDRKFNIALLEKANLSTFLHESGHFYLEVLGDLATAENASPQIQADYAEILKFVGLESRDQLSLDGKTKGSAEYNRAVEAHEKFARANEAYLMEGKAPSEELRSIFQRFKSWLTMIYKQMSALNVELTKEVREVFDRIYASEEEIEAAKEQVNLDPLFLDAAAAGMTEAEFAAYQESIGQATASGKEALTQRLMRELQREKQDWWKKASAEMRKEVEVEVDLTPVYAAFKALVDGKVGDEPVKLNKQAIVDKYGKEYFNRLPRAFNRVYTTKGGMDADSAAEFLGFDSGDALIEALVSMKPREEYIKAEVDRRMREVHGDMMTDGTIADEAKIALHNSQREQVLMAELRALRRKQREVAPFVRVERDKAKADRQAARQAANEVPPAKTFRDAAQALISGTAIRDLEPYRYLQAQRRAAKEAFTAMSKGDYTLASNAKQRELLNHHLYLEATKAREEADAILKYAQKFDKASTRQRIGKAQGTYLEQIDAILDRYEFRRVPLRQIDRRQSLGEWIASEEAAGNEPAIDARLLDEARKVNYREVSISELRAIRDSVKNIEHLASLKNKLSSKFEKIEFADAIDELVTSAQNNAKNQKPLAVDEAARTRLEKAGDTVSRLDAMLLKTEQLVEWLDGGRVDGPWHTYLWNPIAQAQNDENDLTRVFTQKMSESLEAMPKEQRLSMLDTFDIPGIGRVTRKYIISMALNMGNQENIDKMMRGHGWTMNELEAAFDKLNAADWRFVQNTWDTVNELWPQIAELEKRMTGVVPPKVEAQPYKVMKGGEELMTLAGGYYPLVYDSRQSEAGAKQESGSVSQLFEEGYVRATTAKGHTQARSEGFAAPLLLDFEQVVTQHLAKVIKDLTHREAVVAANRILTNRDIRKTLQETLGVAYEKQLLPWLRSVVNDRNGGSTQGLSDFSNWMMMARANVVQAVMGFKATTGIAQITGISQSLDKVKGRYLSQAVLEFLRHPVALTREVQAMSSEMKNRPQNLDRDIRGRLKQLTGQQSKWAQVQRFGFHGIALADMMVSVPTWMGAYRQAIDEGKSQDVAKLEADAAVRMTQGAGGPKDLSAIQRNNELAKALTMFYSYFNVLYNRMRDMGRDVQEIKDMPRFLSRVFFTVMVPAVLGELILGRGPDDDEDEAAWAIRKVLLYPLMSIPVLRDVASSIDSGYDYRFSPMASAIEKIAKVATSTGKLIEGDLEPEQYALRVAEMMGYVFGVAGTAQISATGKYLWRVSEGEENPDNVAELIAYAMLGKKKEK